MIDDGVISVQKCRRNGLLPLSSPLLALGGNDQQWGGGGVLRLPLESRVDKKLL